MSNLLKNTDFINCRLINYISSYKISTSSAETQEKVTLVLTWIM